MTTRETLITIFSGGHESQRQVVSSTVDDILAKHAHELAEKIRADADEWDGWPEKQASMRYAADLIGSEMRD